MKFELFSGFDYSAQRAEAEAKRLKLEASLKQELLSARTLVESAYWKFNATEARVHLEEQNVERANRYYKSILSDYKRGVKNSVDMRVAADTLLDAMVRREAYKYELVAQKADLERALGGPVETELKSGAEGH